jgi:hypothetical protein
VNYDNANCGACGHACAPGQSCLAGMCRGPYTTYAVAPTTATFMDACAVTGATVVSSTTVDDQTFPVTMAFPFQVYATVTSHAFMSSNGGIDFGAVGDPTYTNQCLPSGLAGSPHVFPFWDDLYGDAGVGQMCMASVGAEPNRQIVFTWSHWNTYSPHNAMLNISAILDEATGAIDFVYGSMTGTASDGSSATVGIESPPTRTQIGCNMAGTVAPMSGFHLTPM